MHVDKVAARTAFRRPHAALVVVDFQKGFLSGVSADLLTRVSAAVDRYEHLAFLTFSNPAGSMYRRHLDWHDFTPGAAETGIAVAPPERAHLFEKTRYSGATPDLLGWLGRISPEEVHLAGVDTEACVMATAVALFDAGVRPVVLASLCASNSGRDLHEAALRILRITIGDHGVR